MQTTYDLKQSPRAQKAHQLFLEGCNCSQAVFLAFKDLYDIDYDTAMRLSSAFGGGMGRLREVCGAVSGMFLVAGLLYGSNAPMVHTVKAELYQRIQELAAAYEQQHGSIVCRELLGLKITGKDSHIPEQRTADYYKKRPCPELAASAAAILEQYIKEHPL